MDIAVQNGHGHMTADEAEAGGEAEACHHEQGLATDAEDVVSLEMAARTAASDVAADNAVRKEGSGVVVAAVEATERRLY